MAGARKSSLTCTVDGLAYLVSDDAADAGILTGHGACIALCGHTVRIAPMVCPAGRSCPQCARLWTVLHAEQGYRGSPSYRRRSVPRTWLQWGG
jgi:hypothetical protein